MRQINVERLKAERRVRILYQDARNRNREEGANELIGQFIAFENGAQVKSYRWLDYKDLRRWSVSLEIKESNRETGL